MFLTPLFDDYCVSFLWIVKSWMAWLLGIFIWCHPSSGINIRTCFSRVLHFSMLRGQNCCRFAVFYMIKWGRGNCLPMFLTILYNKNLNWLYNILCITKFLFVTCASPSKICFCPPWIELALAGCTVFNKNQ